MKKLIVLISLSLFFQSASGQAQRQKDPGLYEPHMEELFASWATVKDSLSQICKDGCSVGYDFKRGEIPFRIHLRNTSKAFRMDDASIKYMVKEVVHHRHTGFIAVEASEYEGPHRDTLVIDLKVNKKGYWLKLQFNQNFRGQWIRGVYCSPGQYHEVHSYEGVAVDSLSEEKLEEMWASSRLNDMTLSSNLSLALIKVFECYFEQKQWPVFYDFDEIRRSTNPWYIRRRGDK